MSKMRRKWAVADCETLPFKKRRKVEAHVWEFWDGETRFVTYDTAEFVEYLREYKGIVYAHNGGKFDWHFLLPYFDEYEDVMIINGRIARIRLGECELRDSFNLISEPLSVYKKDTFDYSILEPGEREKTHNKKKILAYLHNDCVYLHELLSAFFEEYGLHLTQAGAAMKMWVKLSEKPAPATNAAFYDEFAPFYYGGRVECFEGGIINEKISSYDINGAYPAAMLHPHPYSESYNDSTQYESGADFYTVRCRSYGAFAYREGQTLTFPNDRHIRVFTVTKWEYAAAIETRTISDVEVLRSVTFHDHTDFSTYINHFTEKRWKCKEAGDVAGSLFAKRFQNSLYGKFAANPEEYKNYMIVPMDVMGGLPCNGWSASGEFGPWGLAEQPQPEERRRYYNVATGASITGYVRAQLWRAICGSERVIYCDTDSIKCVRAGVGVDLGDGPGQWKLEGVFDKIGIAGKKLYIMRGAAGWWSDENGKTVQQKQKPKGGARLYATASKGARLTQPQLWRVAAGGVAHDEREAPTFSIHKGQTFVTRKIQNTVTRAKQVDTIPF